MSKAALLIGINYYNTPYQLSGCINDIIATRDYLVKNKNYEMKNITCMRDDNILFKKPTKTNIITELKKFIQDSNKLRRTEIWFHFSGHGTYVRDINGDELDKKDEVICPLDMRMITDDELRNIFSGLNDDTLCYVCMDCCHSGTNMDLPYLYDTKGNNIILKEDNASRYRNLSKKNIYSMSGCKDNQYSADAFNIYSELNTGDRLWSITRNNTNGGALTSNMLKLLRQGKDFTEILPELRELLKNGSFDQLPQLSTTKKVGGKPKLNSGPAPVETESIKPTKRKKNKRIIIIR